MYAITVTDSLTPMISGMIYKHGHRHYCTFDNHGNLAVLDEPKPCADVRGKGYSIKSLNHCL